MEEEELNLSGAKALLSEEAPLNLSGAEAILKKKEPTTTTEPLPQSMVGGKKQPELNGETPSTSSSPYQYTKAEQIKQQRLQEAQNTKFELVKQRMAKDLLDNPSKAYKDSYVNTLTRLGYNQKALSDFANSIVDTRTEQEKADDINAQMEKGAAQEFTKGVGDFMKERGEAVVESAKGVSEGLSMMTGALGFPQLHTNKPVAEQFAEMQKEQEKVPEERALDFLKGATKTTAKTAGALFNIIPQAVAFQGAIELIKKGADKAGVDKQTQRLIDLPFTLASYTAEKLGYKPEQGSFGADVLELLDLATLVGGHKAVSSGAKKVVDAYKKAQEFGEAPELTKEDYEAFSKEMQGIKIDDLADEAEKQGKTELAAKIENTKPTEQLHEEAANLQADLESKPELAYLIQPNLDKVNQRIAERDFTEINEQLNDAKTIGEISELKQQKEGASETTKALIDKSIEQKKNTLKTPLENDKENETRLSSEIGEREEPIQTEPNRSGSETQVSGDRVVQKSPEEIKQLEISDIHKEMLKDNPNATIEDAERFINEHAEGEIPKPVFEQPKETIPNVEQPIEIPPPPTGKVGEQKEGGSSVEGTKKTNTVGGYEFTQSPTFTEKDGLKVTKLSDSDANIVSQQIFVTDKKNTVKEGVTNEGGGWYSFDTDSFGGKTLYNKETGEAVSIDHNKGGRMASVINDFVKNNDRTKQPIIEGSVQGEKGKQQPISETKEGFTVSKDLNKMFTDLKAKYGDKKGSELYDAASRLVNPTKNTIVEIRSNGVVVKEDGKYILKPFGNTDANSKKWTLYKGIDVSEQFKQPLSEKETSEQTVRENWSSEQQKIENDKTLSPKQKEEAKVESTAKALEKTDIKKNKNLFTIGKKIYDSIFSDLDTKENEIKEFLNIDEKQRDKQLQLEKGKLDKLQRQYDRKQLTTNADINALEKQKEKVYLIENLLKSKKTTITDIDNKLAQYALEKYPNIFIKKETYPFYTLKGFDNVKNNIISEAYHKAKADGSNPELVKAVEDLLGKPKEKVSEIKEPPTNEQKVADNGGSKKPPVVSQETSRQNLSKTFERLDEIAKEFEKGEVTKELRAERKRIFDENPNIKEVNDNFSKITKQLEEKGELKKSRPDCP